MKKVDKYPKYSVLMSVYYKEKPEWLDYSIDSMLKQTIFPDEFVLVEDGPLTPELDSVVEKYVKKYPKLFNIVKIKKNGGLGPALKKGVEACSNEYIARMDSDDYSYPQRFEKQINLMDSDLSIDLSTGAMKVFDEYNNRTFVYGDADILNGYLYQKVCLCFNVNFVCHPLVMIRRALVEKYNLYYSEDYKYAEDYELWSRCFKNLKIVNIPEVLLIYYRSTNSVSVKHNKLQRINALRISLDNLKKYYGKDFNKLVDVEYKIVNNEKLTYRDVKLYMDYYTYLTTLYEAKKYGVICVDKYLKNFIELIKLSDFDIRLFSLLFQSKVLVYFILKYWKMLRKNLLNLGK